MMGVHDGRSHHGQKKPFTFLLHSFCATGHVLPMQAVARFLVDRGHRVVWVAAAAQESRVLASGATFVPTVGVALADARLLSAQPATLEETADVLFGGRVTGQVADLRRAIGDLGLQVDCLLIDALTYGGAALHELREVPRWATLGVVPMYAPACNFKPTSALGTLLSTAALALPVLNSQRAELGLPPWSDDDFSNYSPLLHLQASCASLEFGQVSERTHYVGPLVMGRAPSKWPEWWDEVAAHPCVVGITQGTFAVDPSTLLIPAIEALCGDPDLLLVVPSSRADFVRESLVSRGFGLDNVRLAEWVPYDLLLPRCRVLVTNGGYGSVTQALSHGVPLICAGTSEDKKDTAARVRWVGAGIDLKTDTPSRETIQGAVREILGDGCYRERAKRIGAQLNALGGAAKACALLEKLIQEGLGKPEEWGHVKMGCEPALELSGNASSTLPAIVGADGDDVVVLLEQRGIT